MSASLDASTTAWDCTNDSGVLKAFLVQISILANHQNGKDTHLRGVKVFAPVVEYVCCDDANVDQLLWVALDRHGMKHYTQYGSIA
jgi:anaphase-promoting complex subunit 10